MKEIDTRSGYDAAQHVGLFLGFLSVELARRDWRAVKVMLVMAFGFAIPFAAGGYWHTLRGADPAIDWWKNWEMTIGLGGGLAFGLAFYLFNRPSEPPRRPALRLERIVAVGPVLLALYCLYVASSAILFATLLVRRMASPTPPDGVA